MKLKTLFLKTPFLLFLCFLPAVYPVSAGADDLTDINTAGLKELSSLAGLNENKAKLILESRKKYGNFACPWCIGRRVKGIGIKTVEKFITGIKAGDKSYEDICDKCREKFSESYAGLTKANEPVPEAAPAAQAEAPKPSVSINSDPQDAKLFIDGKFAGYTPFTSSKIPPGKHEIKLEKKEYESASDFIKVKDGEPDALTVTLKPVAPIKEEAGQTASPEQEKQTLLAGPAGKILVDSQPRGRTITVNGKATDKNTPFELTGLPAGDYSINVDGINGDGGETRQVALKEGEAVDLVFISKPAPPPPASAIKASGSVDLNWWELWKR